MSISKERFGEIGLALSSFSHGQRQDFRTMLNVLEENSVSVDEFKAYVEDELFRVLSPVDRKIIKKMRELVCLMCGGPLLMRALSNNTYEYRSNLACAGDCMFDHYDKRPLEVILNEGIRINVSESTDKGSSAEPVVGKE